MQYGIRVSKGGKTGYLKAVLNDPKGYGPLSEAASTRVLSIGYDWYEYVSNDLANGSIDSFDVVRFDIDVVVVDVKNQLDAAARERALSKLTAADKKALGL